MINKLRYTIPNSLTALSLLLGLASIVTTQFGDLEFAAWLIVWCGLLDTLDGVAARMLNATSSFGAEFDSMADVISFGVAPAILLVNAGVQVGGIEYDTDQFWVLLLAAGVFALAGAMRLARFNIATDAPKDGWFTGVPITACGGGILSSLVLVLVHYCGITRSFPEYLLGIGIVLIVGGIIAGRISRPRPVEQSN